MITPPDGSEEVLNMFLTRVPALATGDLEVKAMARERGRRCILFVHSKDPAVDSVGAFIGTRGEHVKAIAKELNTEPIDVVRWTDSTQQVICNALAPLHLSSITMDESSHRATVAVDEKSSEGRSIDLTRLKLVSRALGWEVRVSGSR